MRLTTLDLSDVLATATATARLLDMSRQRYPQFCFSALAMTEPALRLKKGDGVQLIHAIAGMASWNTPKSNVEVDIKTRQLVTLPTPRQRDKESPYGRSRAGPPQYRQ